MSIENYGKYQLIKRLAMGGMAQIYLARRRGAESGDASLLVVKRILPHLAENDEFVRMFLDEARIAARLDHPNIVQIFDLGAQDDSFFIAMEYIHGEDLRRVWKRAERSGQLIPVPLVCRIMSQACAGLDHAHKQLDAHGRPLNIVHRDISPQNILLTFEGRVKVVDFGIAKAADQATETRSGVLKGKYSYMSPEQAAGEKLDRRSDIFALGVVLYELLTGTRLFKRANDMVTLQAVSECIIQPPSQLNARVPRDLDALVMKALQRDLGQRYSEAQQLQRALEEWLDAQPQPSSSAHVAAYMKELYAARLAEEARVGDVLVEEAEAGSPAGAQKAADRAAQTMAAPRQDPDAPVLRTPSRPSRSEQRVSTSERRSLEARRTVDLRRAPEPSAVSQPELSDTTQEHFSSRGGPPGRDQPSSTTQEHFSSRGGPPGRDQPSSTTQEHLSSSRTSPPGRDQPSTTTASDATQQLDAAIFEKTVSRPSRARPSLSVPTPFAPAEPPTPATPSAPVIASTSRPRRSALVWVGAAVVVGLLVGAAMALHSEPPPAPVATPPPPRTTPAGPAESSQGTGTGTGPRPLAPTQVQVTLSTTPPQALVTVDGKRYDKTPVVVAALAGQVLSVSAEAPHYQPLTRKVTVGQEQTQQEPLVLNPLAETPHEEHKPESGHTSKPPPRPPTAETRWGSVLFAVTPWAEVTCGGRHIGQTPLPAVQMQVGAYDCKFSNPEMGTQTQRIDVKPTGVTRVVVKF